MDYKEIFQILVEHRDVSYATSIFAAMAVGILVWFISTRAYRRENRGLRVTIRDQEVTIQSQQATFLGQEATIETLEEPIELSKDMLWSLEISRVALEKTIDELTQSVERIISDDPASKEAVEQATASTRTALADLKNAGMRCLEAFLADPDSAS